MGGRNSLYRRPVGTSGVNIWAGSISFLLFVATGWPSAVRASAIRLADPLLPASASLTPTLFPARCSALAPAQIRGPSVQWLGSCINGKAEGLGVLRVGTAEPFAFLVGRMKAGRPLSGHVLDVDRNMMEAMGFDDHGRVIIADGEHIPQQDRVWADAVRAARNVAAHFAAAGNQPSALYYRRFAGEIENGRPE